MLKKFTSPLFCLGIIFSISSLVSIQAQENIGSFFRIPSNNVSDGTSFLIRSVCYGTERIIIASNSKGADVLQLGDIPGITSCTNSQVEQVLEVNAEYAGKNTSGILRKHCIAGYSIQSYTPVNGHPSLTAIRDKNNTHKRC